ncbi:MAG: IdeS/Mac family cysteine endopeptidase [Opitutales bacterium]|nr:IdeS/Mac family cysteine endopeptidase [Opitutales bacterium]
MKNTVLIPSLLLLLPAGTLTAASVWAPGVTADSGWYDVNKRSNSNLSTTDRNFCWAAVASNMLQWWCDTYEKAGNTVPGNILRNTTTDYTCGIFENVFLKNWDPGKGCGSYEGLQWFFEGKSPTTSNYSKPTGGGNYLSGDTGFLATMADAYGAYSATWASLRERTEYDFAARTENYAICLGGNYYTWGSGRPDKTHSSAEVFSNYLTTLLNHGPVGLSFAVGYNGFGKNHEITVWGCDVGNDGLVSKIYVTDSDDSTADPLNIALNSYNVSYTGNYAAIDYNEAKLFSGNYVTQLSGIMGYPALVIPEPSLFGFFAGTLALLLAGTRRRRKNQKMGK